MHKVWFDEAWEEMPQLLMANIMGMMESKGKK